MKRIGNIYQKICNLDNIKLAITEASRGKKDHRVVSKCLNNLDECARSIQEILINKSYVPSEPIIKTIQDATSGKVREIYKPRFYPDQIVHWSLLLQLSPIIMRGMYRYSCGSVPKRGTTDGQKAIRKWLDKDKKHTKYCLKMDVKKFYPSIDNDILKQMFRAKVKDKDCLWLIDLICDSTVGQPIGYYTSQWFANFFLEGLDHHIKETLGVKYYVRYVDDLVMFGNNKRKLHKVCKEIDAYLSSIKLKVKENWQVFRVDKRDVDFLGVRMHRNHTTLRRKTSLRIRRRMNKIRKKGHLNEADAHAVISYWGWIKRTDSFNYYHKYIKPVTTIHEAKKVVSINAKIRINQERGIISQRNYAAKL